MATITAQAPAMRDMRPWMCRFVRVGYAAKGVIYLLIGTLALRLALGEGGRLTDTDGVLKTLLNQPFGLVMMAVIGIGILAYAAWEITEAVTNAKRKGWMDRGLSIIKAGVYGAVGVQAIRLVFGNGGSSRNADDYARTAMRLPFGEFMLILVGVGIAAYGVKQIMMAWKGRFDDDLNQQQLRREGGGWVLDVGRAGIGARGVIMTIAGVALVRAGFDRSPGEAAGMTEAMWTLFAQPNGQWLLAIVAAGLMCFGFFQLLHARYARL